MTLTDAKLIELVEAIYLLRNAGWTVEPPAEKRGTTARRTSKGVGRPSKKRVGRPPKKRVGRPPKKRVGRPSKEIASSNQASQGAVQSAVVGQWGEK